MAKSLKTRVVYGVKTALALVPWIVAMYVFFWLDSSGTWTPDTPHRGKMSVVLLAGGMLLSFLAYSIMHGRGR